MIAQAIKREKPLHGVAVNFSGQWSTWSGATKLGLGLGLADFEAVGDQIAEVLEGLREPERERHHRRKGVR